MKWIRCGLCTVSLFCLALMGFAQVPGAVMTLNPDGAPQESFGSRDEVFLGAGPAGEPCLGWEYLSDGLYYFQVTDPTGVNLLSTDPVRERTVRVAGGVIASYEGATHATGGWNACGSLAVGLMPFNDAGGRTAAYLVWLTPAEHFDGDPEEVDPVCGDGCFHGFRPELSKTFVARVEQRRNCDRTFCASGVKFEDRNGNGVRDSGEPGLGGVEIRVFDEKTGVFFSTLTFPDGSYRVCGLTHGRSFRIVEVPPFGFTQTGPLDRRLSRRIIARDRGYFIEFCDEDVTGLDFGNRLLANAIGGLKFEDFNANGVRDPGEPGLAGVTIRLTPSAGPAPTVVTDAAGNFIFTNVTPGTYVLSEVVPAGFTQTAPAPPGTITVTLASGGSSINNLFGNFRGILTGTVSGLKFNDLNGNGTRDAGEPGLEGVTITLTPSPAPPPLPPPPSDRTTVTGPDGSFAFTSVLLGTHVLREAPPAGFVQTAPPPPGTITVTLTLTQRTSTNNFFGNRAVGAVISGTKFNDLNGNGLRDANEPGIAGVMITLVLVTQPPVPPDAFRTTVTDSSGNFSFTGLSAGSFVVSEAVPMGFVQTAPPAPGTFSFTLAAGESRTGLLFGNRVSAGLGSISGLKILDFDGDGLRDPEDRPFEGIVFRLTDSSGMIRETRSGADGTFRFSNLPAGTYVLTEVLPPGFAQTFPGTPDNPRGYTITLAPEQNATGFVFLNKC